MQPRKRRRCNASIWESKRQEEEDDDGVVPQEVAETEAHPEQGQETGGHKEAVPDQGPGDQGDDPPTPYRSKQQGTKNAHKTQKTGHDMVMFMRKSARQRSLVGASNKSLAKVKAYDKKPMQKK